MVDLDQEILVLGVKFRLLLLLLELFQEQAEVVQEEGVQVLAQAGQQKSVGEELEDAGSEAGDPQVVELGDVGQQSEEGEEDVLLGGLVPLALLPAPADVAQEQSQQLEHRLQPVFHVEKLVQGHWVWQQVCPKHRGR